MDLQGSAIIVTGASSGIGRATARRLAGSGARVAIAARRRDRLEALAASISREGGTVLTVPTDVTRREAVQALADRTLGEFGTIDALVNNAGVMPLAPLAALDVDGWDRMIDVNLKGVLYGIAAVLPTMLDRGRGHIVNVGSVAGRRAIPTGTVYCATKFAVRAITQGMQLELSAPHQIRVTDVQPGVVDTELPSLIEHAEARTTFQTRWGDKRALSADDVAGAIEFALTQPDHVNVNEILVRPTDQAT